MELGLQIATPADYEQLRGAACLAEERGLAVFALPDHYFSMGSEGPVPESLDVLTLLAGLARETASIGLATLVSPITFRHPATTAKAAVTIDRLSGGRFELGVGAGWLREEYEAFGIDFPAAGERFEGFEEAVAYVRALLHGTEGFEGRTYRLQPRRYDPPPVGPLPLIVGGSGARRTPVLAGRYGDEYNVALADFDGLRDRADRARAAAAAAGRDPGALRFSVMAPALVATDDDDWARRLAAVAAREHIGPDEVLDLCRAKGVVHGPPRQVRGTLERLCELGVQRLYLQYSADLTYHESLESLEPVEQLLSIVGDSLPTPDRPAAAS